MLLKYVLTRAMQVHIDPKKKEKEKKKNKKGKHLSQGYIPLEYNIVCISPQREPHAFMADEQVSDY